MEKANLHTTLQQAQAALKKYWYVPGLLILLAVLFLAGSWYGKSVADQHTAGGRRIVHYVDPMNPAHTFAEPGLAPCGMKMEPVYADDGGQAAGAAMPPGSRPGQTGGAANSAGAAPGAPISGATGTGPASYAASTPGAGADATAPPPGPRRSPA
jgi:hypothetical protein